MIFYFGESCQAKLDQWVWGNYIPYTSLIQAKYLGFELRSRQKLQ